MLKIALTWLLLLGTLTPAHSQECPTAGSGRLLAVPTSQEAVDRAMPHLIERFGVERVNRRAPYVASRAGAFWQVEGTMPEGTVGGTPQARVCAATGIVSEVAH